MSTKSLAHSNFLCILLSAVNGKIQGIFSDHNICNTLLQFYHLHNQEETVKKCFPSSCRVANNAKNLVRVISVHGGRKIIIDRIIFICVQVCLSSN